MNEPASVEKLHPSPRHPALTTPMPRLLASEPIGPGDVVGVSAGRISRKTEGADWVQIVRADADAATACLEVRNHFLLCLLGDTAVRTIGMARRGDLLLASGNDDGTAVAVPAQSVIPEIAHWIVGRALRDKRGTAEALLPVTCVLPPALLTGRHVLDELMAPEVWIKRAAGHPLEHVPFG